MIAKLGSFWDDYVPSPFWQQAFVGTYRGRLREMFVPCSETGTNRLTLGGLVWYKSLDRQPLGRFVLIPERNSLKAWLIDISNEIPWLLTRRDIQPTISRFSGRIRVNTSIE